MKFTATKESSTVGAETSTEWRYYWSSHVVDAKSFTAMISGIEVSRSLKCWRNAKATIVSTV